MPGKAAFRNIPYLRESEKSRKRCGENGSMRKKVIDPLQNPPVKPDGQWFDIEEIASLEVTSEDPNFPVDNAFGAPDGAGWRAAGRGEQQIRILFDEPQPVRRMQLRFREEKAERTQEFAVAWSPNPAEPTRQIVRQQWNFSPSGSTTEAEDYTVDLPSVAVLELTIRPDLGRQDSVASLESWRVG